MNALAALAPSPEVLTEVRWGWPWPPWVAGLLAVAAVAWVAAIYANEQRFVRMPLRMLLALLRLAAVAIVLVMLAQPTIERQRVAPPRLVLLLDRSGSMGTRDIAAADLPAAGSATGNVSRIEAWQNILSAGSQGLLNELRARYDVDVVLFDAKPAHLQIDPEETSDQPLSLTAGAGAANADGTRLGDALDYAIRQVAGPRPVAVVAMTDGINTAGLPLAEAAARARTLGVPIYAVALGSERPRADVSLDDVLVEEVVFPGDRLQVDAMLRSTGYEGRSARVVLREAESGTVLAETHAALPADGQSQMFRLALRPTEPGMLRVELEVDRQPGEDDASNNRAELTLEVRQQRIRTLLVQSTPSYEYRALKSLLERDPAIDLRVRLHDADVEYTEIDAAAIREFPASEAELLMYDVVLLGDVDPQLIPRAARENLEKFVSDHGGGLAIIAGTRYMPRRFEDVAAMRVLLPIELGGIPLRGQAASPDGFTVQPTALGSREASLQLGETPEESAAIWEQLPPVMWIAPVELKPGVQILAEHPPRSGDAGQPLPVIMRHYVGAGEVLMHATDETWRWRWRSDDRYFARYWGQAVRRLARGRVLRGAGSLSTNRAEYQLGEPITLRARLRPTEPPADEAIVAELEGASSPTEPVRLERRGAFGHVFEAVLHDLPPDRYTARLTTDATTSPVLTADFDVKAPPGELSQLVVNTPGLSDAAETSGGKLYTAKTDGRLVDELPPAKPTAVERLPDEPLWNRPWLLAALCATLGAEWLLRRRWGML